MKKLLFILCFIGIWYLTCNATQSYLVSNIVQTEEQTPVATEENSTTEESSEPATEESSEPAAEETSETATEETPAEESSQNERKTSSSSSVSSKKSSSSDDASSSQSSSNGEKKGDTGSSSVESGNPLGTLFFIALIVFVIILYKRYKKRCPECGKWGAMKFDSQETIKEQQIRMLKQVLENGKDKHLNAPGTRRTIRIHLKCKNCGYREYYDKTKDTVNK